MKNRARALWVGLACAQCVAGAHGQTTRYVNAQLTTGASNGASWADAFQGPLGLQAALAVAQPGDEIWVAQGTYRPAPAGQRAVSFILRAQVAIYGGFSGAEAQRTDRDHQTHLTILSGDLLGNGNLTPSNTDNTHHVVLASGVDSSAVLDGFTISGGATPGNGTTVDRSGAGMLITGASPIVRNCTFSQNTAGWMGGDIAIVNSSPLIESCAFVGTSLANRGLAIGHTGDSSATIRACRFFGTPLTTGGMAGLGIFSDTTSVTGLIVDNCDFTIRARDFTCSAGVGIATWTGSKFTVHNSRFINNWTCGGGGGMYCDGFGTIDRCVFVNNDGLADGGGALFSFNGETTITNSLFVGNNKGESGPGGGISTITAQGVMHFVNCTFANNGSTLGTRTLIHSKAAGTSFDNCIIWNNINGGPASQTLQFVPGGSPSPIYNNCLVQGWTGVLPGVSSFTATPMFVSPNGSDGVPGTLDDDLRLLADSPCVERGNGAALAAVLTRDLDNLPRVSNVQIDLGAYEFQCRADFDGLGGVTIADVFEFLNAWFTGDVRADITSSDVLEIQDIFAFLNLWFAGC